MRSPRVPWPLPWAMLQLGLGPGWLLEPTDRPWSPPTFSPARLPVSEGDNATFTCSVSDWSEHHVLNWYRLSPSNQRVKLASFLRSCCEPGHDPRFQVMQLPSGRDFNMTIVATRLNDSGIYLCGAISLPPRTQIKESPYAELAVTERIVEAPTANPSPSPRPPRQLQGLVVGVTSVLVGVPALLLLAWVLTAVCSRDTPEAGRAGSKEKPLKEDPSTVPVFSVAYGELDFQCREKALEPPAPGIHTEYATIVFPDGLGASPLGRRGSVDGPPGPQARAHEDGHCSWPL